jgi:arabinose-5-phosphate isomerase
MGKTKANSARDLSNLSQDDLARELVEQGRRAALTEAEALARLPDRIGDAFAAAGLKILERCTGEGRGRLVLCGMGKPGFVAQKLSATFASTGIPSFPLHPADALHGDLGRLGPDDVIILLSNSGRTEEILALMGPLRRIGPYCVAITSKPESPMAQLSDVVIDIGPVVEACPLGLAPTTSSTAMLVLGDALAMALVGVRDFDAASFWRFHPAGALGRSLMKVEQVMRKGDALPSAPRSATLAEALAVMTGTEKRPGALCVVDVDESQNLVGFFTDGDLRRLLEKKGGHLDLSENIAIFMTPEPVTVGAEKLASEAARLLSDRGLDQLPVMDGQGKLVGLLDVQDLLALGFFEADLES